MDIKDLKADKSNYKIKAKNYLLDFFNGQKEDEINEIIETLPYEPMSVFTVDDEIGTARFVINNRPVIKLDKTSPYTVMVEGLK